VRSIARPPERGPLGHLRERLGTLGPARSQRGSRPPLDDHTFLAPLSG